MTTVQCLNLRAIFQFENLIGDTRLVEQLISLGLIPPENAFPCPNCGSFMVLTKDAQRPDGFRWFCGERVSVNKQKTKLCRTRVEFRHGTFFERSHLPIWKILGFVHLWVEKASLRLIGIELGMGQHALNDWASYCREVVFDYFFTHPEKLGGPGKVVEIDESKFGKRKYHRGHMVEGQWVFGGYERGSGRVFMVAVESRDSNRLLSVIREWVEKGTTIISDYWKAYDCLQDEGFEHLKVNHSLNFKDPETGAHTNAIESSWRAAKASMSSSGRIKAHVPGNLARYMFAKKCQELKMDRTAEFLRIAGKLYNPLSPRPDPEPYTDDSDGEDFSED